VLGGVAGHAAGHKVFRGVIVVGFEMMDDLIEFSEMAAIAAGIIVPFQNRLSDFIPFGTRW
jgi:hypothetical protein